MIRSSCTLEFLFDFDKVLLTFNEVRRLEFKLMLWGIISELVGGKSFSTKFSASYVVEKIVLFL